MTSSHSALVKELEIRAKLTGDYLTGQAHAALREQAGEIERLNRILSPQSVHGLPGWRDFYNKAALERDTLASELVAEKAAHLRTCQTAAYEAEKRDKAEAERDTLAEEAVTHEPKRMKWQEWPLIFIVVVIVFGAAVLGCLFALQPK